MLLESNANSRLVTSPPIRKSKSKSKSTTLKSESKSESS